jgi:hypothetical protein
VENLTIVGKKSKFISKFTQNDRDNVVIEFVFINFKRSGAIKFHITN